VRDGAAAPDTRYLFNITKFSSMKKNIEKAALMDMNLSKEQLSKGLQSDLQMAFTVVGEIISDPKLYNAVLDVYWDRYLALKESHLKKQEVTNETPVK
jgi:hypothetical protein